MENSKSKKFASIFPLVVIPLCILICYLIYFLILGDPDNFIDEEKREPVAEGVRSYLGIIYKGGLVVPVLMSFFLMVITFAIERFITIRKAYGGGALDEFLHDVKMKLAANDINGAIDSAESQKGSVGNVVYSVLHRYKEVTQDKTISKEQKAAAIQQEVEEATSLELPMLQKNLPILATLASIATLVGLFGTVLGMIKAFKALAVAGTPDMVELANGISEALINTALGIASSALAIIFYNLFTTRIDTLTYSIDEIGFSIMQNFNTHHQGQPKKEVVL